MRKTALILFVSTFAAFAPAIQQQAHAAQTFNGTVSDSMCEKKHMMPGKTPGECIEECVKAGSTYVLVTGDKVYTLSGKPQSLAKFAGKHVSVQGALKGNMITAEAIQEK
jgi:hypothetical protein